ncbi:MAG: sulfite exporter TauE/SafE family protein [Bdellovibrionota bacterium]
MEGSIWLSALVMGFLGSWHCGVMCGPLCCNFKTKKDFYFYQLGRLASYLVVGTVLFFGTHYFLTVDSRPLKLVASVFFGVLFITFGLAQINILKNDKLAKVWAKLQLALMRKYRKQIQKFPILLGLFTGFFPCGWLYSFLLLSTQMKSLSASLLVILIFWLTALPAFALLNGFMQKLIKSSPLSYQKISACILIIAGLFSILGHWSEIIFL